MNADRAHTVVSLSMIWLGFLVIASRPWKATIAGKSTTTDALGQVKTYVQSKVKKA